MPRDPLRSAAGLPLALGEHLAPHRQRMEHSLPDGTPLYRAATPEDENDAAGVLPTQVLVKAATRAQALLKRRLTSRGYLITDDELQRALTETLAGLRNG